MSGNWLETVWKRILTCHYFPGAENKRFHCDCEVVTLSAVLIELIDLHAAVFGGPPEGVRHLSP